MVTLEHTVVVYYNAIFNTFWPREKYMTKKNVYRQTHALHLAESYIFCAYLIWEMF